MTKADLMRPEAGTERPSSWWLSLLLGDHKLAADYVKSHSTKVNNPRGENGLTCNALYAIADLFEARCDPQ